MLIQVFRFLTIGAKRSAALVSSEWNAAIRTTFRVFLAPVLFSHDRLVSTFTAFTSLRKIDFSACSAVDNRVIAVIATSLRRLDSLSTVHTCISDYSSLDVSGFQLDALSLGAVNYVTDATFASLPRSLKRLTLYNDIRMVTPAGIDHLGRLLQLRTLDFRGTSYALSPIVLPRALASTLEVLYAILSDSFIDLSMRSLDDFTALRRLIIDDVSMCYTCAPPRLPNLEEFALSLPLPYIDDAGIAVFMRGLSATSPNVRSISLSHFGTSTLVFTVRSLRSFANLRRLRLRAAEKTLYLAGTDSIASLRVIESIDIVHRLTIDSDYYERLAKDMAPRTMESIFGEDIRKYIKNTLF